jgi:hypothetical protein
MEGKEVGGNAGLRENGERMEIEWEKDRQGRRG